VVGSHVRKDKFFFNENHTFELMEIFKDKRALKNKWMLKLKIEENYS